jgi:hypothetical protein
MKLVLSLLCSPSAYSRNVLAFWKAKEHRLIYRKGLTIPESIVYLVYTDDVSEHELQMGGGHQTYCDRERKAF